MNSVFIANAIFYTVPIDNNNTYKLLYLFPLDILFFIGKLNFAYLYRYIYIYCIMYMYFLSNYVCRSIIVVYVNILFFFLCLFWHNITMNIYRVIGVSCYKQLKKCYSKQKGVNFKM